MTRREGRAGIITLDRPRALNALDAAMIGAMRAALASWRDDPDIHLVLVESAGRAFCAGGDVRAARVALLDGRTEQVARFFADEYALNEAIATYRKPYVALIDGICMGGGIGISAHGAIRVVTEAAQLAMPETAIGMVPDVGATFLLPRLPGSLGMYMGLTGARMSGPDAVHAGLATHYVRSARLPELRAALVSDGVASVAGFAEALPPFTLAEQRDELDRCFAADDIAALIARLGADESDWSGGTLATLRAMSPFAVHVAHAAIRRGATLDVSAALAFERALAPRITARPDFAEGVRAMVVDKDRRPAWSPARLEQVDPAEIAAVLNI